MVKITFLTTPHFPRQAGPKTFHRAETCILNSQMYHQEGKLINFGFDMIHVFDSSDPLLATKL